MNIKSVKVKIQIKQHYNSKLKNGIKGIKYEKSKTPAYAASVAGMMDKKVRRVCTDKLMEDLFYRCFAS